MYSTQNPTPTSTSIPTLATRFAHTTFVVRSATPLAEDQMRRAAPMRAKIYQNALPIADLEAYRSTTPFHLDIDPPSSAKWILSASPAPDKKDGQNTDTKGPQRTAIIPIVNSDNIGYQFDWTLEISGLNITGGTQRIAPNGHERLCVRFNKTAENKFFAWLDSGFITPNRQEGRLVLRRHADGDAVNRKTDSKAIQLNASFSYSEGFLQSIGYAFFVFLFLFFGVLASLGVNFAIPMLSKKVSLKQALAAYGRALNGQGAVISPRTLSTLRLEIRRLFAAISSQSLFVPETEDALTAVEGRMKALGQRIDITLEAGKHLVNLKSSHLLTLHEVDCVVDLCHSALQVAELASPSETDLAKAQALLSQTNAMVATSQGTPSKETVTDLESRRKELLVHIPLYSLPNEPGTAASSPPQFDSKYGQAWEDLQQHLEIFKSKSQPYDTPTRSQYVEEAEQVWVAERLFEFAELVATAQTSAVYEGRLARARDLMACLSPGASWSAEEVVHILKQIRQNVSKDEFVAAMKKTAPAPQICVEPIAPMAFQIVELRIKLPDEGLNRSEARRLVDCRWMVVDQEELVPIGRGFSTYYFFEPKGKIRSGFKLLAKRSEFIVRAEAFDGEKWFKVGQDETVHLTVNREFAHSSTVLSTVRFVITVIVVTIGMLTVAQEKLQSLDVYSGIVALLVLGFSADVIKRSLSK